MASTADIERRISALEGRVAWLDEHGTRGVDGVRTQLAEQAKDLGKVEEQLAGVARKIDGIAGGRWQRFAAYALALIPVYVMLFLAILHT